MISGAEYNSFNSKYYSATMLTVISLMGLDFVFARNKPGLKIIIFLLISNVLISFGIYSALSGRSEIMILPFLISNVAFSLYTTVLLFENQLRRYLLFSFLYLMFGVLAVTVHKLLTIDFFTIYAACSIALIPGLILIRSQQGRNKIKPGELYILGYSIFLINALSGVIFNIDKYLVNNYLSIPAGNAYTFAWTVLVPVFYIGNLFEKQIYTQSDPRPPTRQILGIAFFNAFSVSGYLLTINYIFVTYGLLPDSVDKENFIRITRMLSLGLFVFSVAHFPINGILLKYSSAKIQKISGMINLFIIVIFIFAVILIQSLMNIDVKIIILLSFTALILSSLAKAFIIRKELSHLNPET